MSGLYASLLRVNLCTCPECTELEGCRRARVRRVLYTVLLLAALAALYCVQR